MLDTCRMLGSVLGVQAMRFGANRSPLPWGWEGQPGEREVEASGVGRLLSDVHRVSVLQHIMMEKCMLHVFYNNKKKMRKKNCTYTQKPEVG